MTSTDQVIQESKKLIMEIPAGVRYSVLHKKINEEYFYFDKNKKETDFEIRVRASRHEPDMFYVNKYMKLIESLENKSYESGWNDKLMIRESNSSYSALPIHPLPSIHPNTITTTRSCRNDKADS